MGRTLVLLWGWMGAVTLCLADLVAAGSWSWQESIA